MDCNLCMTNNVSYKDLRDPWTCIFKWCGNYIADEIIELCIFKWCGNYIAHEDLPSKDKDNHMPSLTTVDGRNLENIW